MFIRFRKSRIAGIISKCAYCRLMTGTILLFINKSDDVFLGRCKGKYSRPVTCQKKKRLFLLVNTVKWYSSVISTHGLFLSETKSHFCTVLHTYLPDLISIWHFGVGKYGPDSPPVFYRLWKHEH